LDRSITLFSLRHTAAALAAEELGEHIEIVNKLSIAILTSEGLLFETSIKPPLRRENTVIAAAFQIIADLQSAGYRCSTIRDNLLESLLL
jgi:hypothetical protein